MYRTSESLVGRVRQQLRNIEKRDWELWTIVSTIGLVVSLGMLVIAVPSAFSRNENLHFEVSVSRPLAAGLVALLVLLNGYLVAKRWEVRRLREEIISNTLQTQLIEQQSFTDPLTEIYNRRSLADIVGRFMSHARRRKAALTFLMVDIDQFKEVNSRLGHLTGDLVLAEMANLLRSSIRGCDAIVRYGGDEFLLLLADTSAEGARSVIARIESHLAEWNQTRQLQDREIDLSIGVAQWHDGQTLDEVLDAADRRMYENKAAVTNT